MNKYNKKGLRIYEMQKTLLLQIYPVLVTFPKSETHAMSKEIKRYISESMGNVILASTVPSKRVEYLQIADAMMRHFQTLIDVSCSLEYISEPFFETVDLNVSNICEKITEFIKNK